MAEKILTLWQTLLDSLHSDGGQLFTMSAWGLIGVAMVWFKIQKGEEVLTLFTGALIHALTSPPRKQ
jgi:hypothetical protein